MLGLLSRYCIILSSNELLNIGAAEPLYFSGCYGKNVPVAALLYLPLLPE